MKTTEHQHEDLGDKLSKPITLEILRARAGQLAVIRGGSSDAPSDNDFAQAEQELKSKQGGHPATTPIQPIAEPALLELLAGYGPRILQAEMRIEAAEARTEQAKTRTEQAEARTEQAETRTDHAKTRAEEAEVRTEQAEARTDQAEARTERAEERTHEVIRASELRYRRLFEAAKEGILILETGTGLISDVNPFLIDMLGLSSHELVGKAIWELGAFRDIISNKNKFEELQHQGYARYENLPLEIKDGRKIAVEFVSNVYQTGSQNVIQCNVRDVTERKLAEDQVRNLNTELERRVVERTSQLEDANKQLQAFSYSVSHDLQSPLRHVMGFVEKLKRDAGPSLSEKCLVSLATISEATKHMGSLIDDLLSFSRLGHEAMRKGPVDLDALVQDTLGDFKMDTQRRNIAWEINPLPSVQADRALLRMVLTNLFSNAIKFTSGRAHAKIEVGSVPTDKAETIIFVRDNGAGFNPEYTSRLFGVFQRLHSADEFAGTGIGLANIHRIIIRHGGRTWAEGKVDEGATFFFSLPNK